MKNAFVVGLALLTLAAMKSSAYPHDIYLGRKDPKTGGSCCSTNAGAGYGDCAKLTIEPGVLTAEADGYRIRLTEEQAQRINPFRSGSVDVVVTWDRVQESPDGNWHICIPGQKLETMRSDFYCFMAPNNI